MFFYHLTYVLTCLCYVLSVLGVLIYIRFSWVFWLYFDPDQDQKRYSWLYSAFYCFICCAVFYQMALGELFKIPNWCYEENVKFLINDVKLVFITILMLVLCQKRWREMAVFPQGNWEREAKRVLPWFIVSAMFIRFLGVIGVDYMADFRYQNAKEPTAEELEAYFPQADQAQGILFFNGKPVEAPRSALRAALDDIKGAVERGKAKKQKKKKRTK